MKKTKSKKWYQGGLCFDCQGCGRCCSGPVEGYVWANNREIQAMAASVKLTPGTFISKYMRRIGIRYSLIEKQPSKDCIFLHKTNSGKTCEIYSTRPNQCRTWPFWKSNLKSEFTWQDAAKTCPGIDRGQWYSSIQIEAILKGESLPETTSTVLALDEAIEWIESHLDNTDYLNPIAELYHFIDRNIESANPNCENCGRCCDFEKYGHRLYVTTLEMLYFIRGLHKEKISPTRFVKGCCPYQDNTGCRAREYRPSGCRIYYCRDLPPEMQSELTEQVHHSLRRLHEDFGLPYYYTNLLEWLEKFPRSKKG